MPERPPKVSRGRRATPLASAVVIVAAAALLAPRAEADGARAAIEFRPGVAIATSTLDGASLDPGLGVDLRLSYALTPHGHVYVGLGRRELAFDAEASFEHEGYALGLEIRLVGPSRTRGVRVAAGITHERTSVSGRTAIGGSDAGTGWELDAAALVPLAGGWTLTPGLRYRSLDDALSLDGVAADAALALVAFEIGALYAF